MNQSFEKLLMLVITAIVGGGGLLVGGQWFVKDKVVKNFSKAQAQASALGDLSYRKLEVSLINPKIQFHGVKFQFHGMPESQKIELDQLITDQISYLDIYNFLTTDSSSFSDFRFRILGLHLNLDQSKSPQFKMIQSMGYSEIVLNFGLQMSYSQKEEILNVKEIWLEADQMMKLSMSFKLGQLALPSRKEIMALSENKAQALEMMGKLTAVVIHSASLSIEDQGLLPRLKYSYYQTTKKDIAYEFAKFSAPPTFDNQTDFKKRSPSQFEKSFINGVSDFLNQPKTLNLVVAPAQPLPVMRLMSPDLKSVDHFVQVLNLKVTSDNKVY